MSQFYTQTTNSSPWSTVITASPDYTTSYNYTFNSMYISNTLNRSLKLPVVKGHFKSDECAVLFFDNYGDFEIGASYKITINGFDIKDLFIVDELSTSDKYVDRPIIQTIYDATFIAAAPRPDSNIKHVLFNEDKGATTVVWKDGTVTVVHCHPDDYYDKEKALAMCFVKKYYGNRGCFNEIIKEYCD